MSEALERLCAACGLEAGYRDNDGAWRAAPPATRLAILAAMGVDGAQPEAALAAIERTRWERVLEPAIVRRLPDLEDVRVQLPAELEARELQWRIAEERGTVRHGRFVAAALEPIEAREEVRAVRLPLPRGIDIGYHALAILDGDQVLGEGLLVVAPERAYLPEGVDRAWGCTLQLYGLRSERNAGIGDFSDLARAGEAWAKRGASFVGTNPLHALDEGQSSPYSPSSRLFHNVLYLDVAAIPDFREAAARDPAFAERWAHASARLRGADLVDYAAVSAAKRPVLAELHAHFAAHHRTRRTSRWRAFERFRGARGASLRRFALHEALREAHGTPWPQWPEPHRDPESPAMAELAREHAEAIERHEYLQWQADLQLGDTQAACRGAGMPIGLYADLAVSIAADGADAWTGSRFYARGMSVGAPPDAFNADGQSWGLPPLLPEALRREAYAPFIEMLRANMAHAGALRIDHVMGLERLFWVPAGAPASEGAYVRYPLADLLAIGALESVRSRTMIVGEDLGTVPETLRAHLERAGILSYRVFLFERDAEAFRAPAELPALALAAWSTHDLPTLAGWWQAAEPRGRDALLAALERGGFPTSGLTASAALPPERIALDLHELLARSPCHLFALQVEDVLGVVEQANVPGTVHEHPNWRRKLAVPVEAWGRHARIRRFAERAVRARGRPEPGPTHRDAPVPRATYRIQLNAGFTFRDAERIVPYLAALGVSHLYCSPCLRARAGSTHGYDIVDHEALNPELGTRADFESLAAALRAHGMGLLLDIVPNHMGVLAADNAWWLDVLESGPASEYARFFDIDWDPPAPHLAGKVLLPILAERYGLELEAGKLEPRFDAASGTLSIHYFEHRLPVDPCDLAAILEGAASRAEGEAARALLALAQRFAALPKRSALAEADRAERVARIPELRAALRDLAGRDAGARAAIEAAVEALRGTPGAPASFEALHALLDRQAWRVAFWRVAQDEINYRRFFDVNELAALRQEDGAVFDKTHGFVASLVAAGLVDALRIDHPDGLYDPRAYFEDLQRACGRPTYVLVEKILAAHESLPEGWSVHGTTGYEFANLVNGLFVDPSAEGRITRAYEAFTRETAGFDELARDCRRHVLEGSLAAELGVLANRLAAIAQSDRGHRDFTRPVLRAALAEVLAAFPVYRTYIDETVRDRDRAEIERAIAAARAARKFVDPAVFDFLQDALLVQLPSRAPLAAAALRHFARKFQQLSAPVMAKGIEDTAFYRYNRLVSLNDVGGSPEVFGVPPARFHRAAAQRARRWPHTLLSTSTHDNKRSEDVRARIDAVSELAAGWRLSLRRWHRLNAPRRAKAGDAMAPSRADEYLLYQTLLGSFPLGAEDLAEYRERIVAYLRKAQREAKRHTSWARVNEAYEAASEAFVRALLDDARDNPFLAELRAAVEPVAWIGFLNGLSMAALKYTSPGVPDCYQGNELWDLSLVDPDNRRPVDFALRARLLAEVGAAADARAIFADPRDGRAKLLVTHRLLQLRREREALFRDGGYVPLRVTGARAKHVVAFARPLGGELAIVVAPRLFGGLAIAAGELPCGERVWRDTAIDASLAAGAALRDTITGRAIAVASATLPLAEVLAEAPVAVLVR